MQFHKAHKARRGSIAKSGNAHDRGTSPRPRTSRLMDHTFYFLFVVLPDFEFRPAAPFPDVTTVYTPRVPFAITVGEQSEEPFLLREPLLEVARFNHMHRLHVQLGLVTPGIRPQTYARCHSHLNRAY